MMINVNFFRRNRNSNVAAATGNDGSSQRQRRSPTARQVPTPRTKRTPVEQAKRDKGYDREAAWDRLAGEPETPTIENMTRFIKQVENSRKNVNNFDTNVDRWIAAQAELNARSAERKARRADNKLPTRRRE